LARDVAIGLGNSIRAARKRRRWSQSQLGDKVGLTGQRIGQIELGGATSATLETLFALSHVLSIPLRVAYQRDPDADVVDAGHLRIQELVLRLGRLTHRARLFELPTRPQDPTHSIDVCLRDDAMRVLFINECWNTFGNINASVRSTHRKVAEAEQLAVAIAGERGPYKVAAVWIVRDTRVNRALIARYPDVFAAAFPGSSAAWVKALTQSGTMPPTQPGLVWADVNGRRIYAWRRR
jgi:transcriptional regulator with XRE-family HTH domain